MNRTTILLTLSSLLLASAAAAQTAPEPAVDDPEQPPQAAGDGDAAAGEPGPPAPAAALPRREPASDTEEPPASVDDVDDREPMLPVEKRLLHGFRLGYGVLMNYAKQTREDGMSYKDKYELKTPHSFLIGYEAFYRVVGHSWLNVLVVGNVMVAGLEQSKFLPNANGLIGFELNHSFQLGVGVNLTPDSERPGHMIVATGWTPRVGSFYTPVHFYFIPDTETNHRAGATVGVTW